jgi:hypothetical protein
VSVPSNGDRIGFGGTRAGSRDDVTVVRMTIVVVVVVVGGGGGGG